MSKYFFWVISFILIGCSQAPQLESPPEGASYSLNQYQTILGTVVGQNYSGVTVRVKGQLPPQVQCAGGQETYLSCTVGGAQTGVSTGTYQSSYTVVFEAVKGNYSSNHLVTFTTGY